MLQKASSSALPYSLYFEPWEGKAMYDTFLSLNTDLMQLKNLPSHTSKAHLLTRHISIV